MPNITIYLPDSLYLKWVKTGKHEQTAARQHFRDWLETQLR
jgi:hypothetical protein